MAPLTLVATSTFGLESVVSRELMALGYEDQTVLDGKVLFQGDESAICRANLWLRSADRVLIQLDAFRATDFDTLFERTKALPWEDWLAIDSKFPVTGKSVRSQLHSTPTCQSVVKKAIVERLKQKYQRHWFEESGAEYKVDVYLLKDQVTLSIDTTGDGLHKRGYRKEHGPAPLKETLAAALIQLSHWKPGRPFIDPFCGTGTMPIEAAMIGLNLAPGLNRSFTAEDWPRIPREAWQQARTEARDLRRNTMPLPCIGCDISGKMIHASRSNAQVAGVGANTQFHKRAFEDIEIERDYGCLITNPPYGARLGESEEIDELYREMGRVLGHLDTWSIYVLTSHSQFEQLYGKPATRRRKLYNGRIECTFYQYVGKRPPDDYSPDDDGDVQPAARQETSEPASEPASEH